MTALDKKTLKALKGSIRKWQRIVHGMGRDYSTRNCPLCKMFYGDDCEGCPVYEASGESGCGGTPYEDWAEYAMDRGMDFYKGIRAVNKKMLNIAKREVEFLQSLLPAKEGK